MPIFSDPAPLRAVQFTRELQRIISIPRRQWEGPGSELLADQMTVALRRLDGTMRLRAIQAMALFDAHECRGFFGPIRVGGGKTLISLLLAYILELRRPLLMLPAKLVEKTQREMRELAYHWPIPNFIKIWSYEILGRPQAAKYLEMYKPDGIIADEAQKLKSKDAAVTIRVDRYMTAYPETMFCAMSGTITKRSLKDFAHIIGWCLPPASVPVPTNWRELEDWADALDEKPHSVNPVQVGALRYFFSKAEHEDPDTLDAARRAFRRRLVETPGVVATSEGFVGSSLSIEALDVKVSADTENAFEKLRSVWETPDEWPITDPLELNRHARELALGFYYRWDPRPPEPWLEARRAWAKAVRQILTYNRSDLDSARQVLDAVESGAKNFQWAKVLLDRWREVEPTFKPNTVPVWFDSSVLAACARWGEQGAGIIWTEHVAFAESLEHLSGIVYYGRKGLNKRGGYIEDHPPSQPLIASVASNAEGRNLQAWCRNLIVSCPPNGLQFEQLLGRTHRDKQRADEVTFEIVLTCLEQASAFFQAVKDAKRIESITGQAQKLLYADCLMPSPTDIASRGGPRWNK